MAHACSQTMVMSSIFYICLTMLLLSCSFSLFHIVRNITVIVLIVLFYCCLLAANHASHHYYNYDITILIRTLSMLHITLQIRMSDPLKLKYTCIHSMHINNILIKLNHHE